MRRTTGKVATWLELATVPHSRDKRVSVQVHPLLPDSGGKPRRCQEECCYTISVDGRWLHAGDGRLTVLKGMEAVDRFMRLVRLPVFEPGEPAAIEVDCSKTAYCMTTGRRSRLHGFG